MKENVEAIAWVIETATFIVAALIAWFVWRISTRASRNRKSGEGK